MSFAYIRDLISGEQRLDEPSLALPQLPVAGEKSLSDGGGDLPIGRRLFGVVLTRAGEHALDFAG